MNRLSAAQPVQVGSALVEGNCIHATVRMTGVAKNTDTKLLVDLGTACAAYQNRVMRDLPSSGYGVMRFDPPAAPMTSPVMADHVWPLEEVAGLLGSN